MLPVQKSMLRVRWVNEDISADIAISGPLAEEPPGKIFDRA